MPQTELISIGAGDLSAEIVTDFGGDSQEERPDDWSPVVHWFAYSGGPEVTDVLLYFAPTNYANNVPPLPSDAIIIAAQLAVPSVPPVFVAPLTTNLNSWCGGLARKVPRMANAGGRLAPWTLRVTTNGKASTAAVRVFWTWEPPEK